MNYAILLVAFIIIKIQIVQIHIVFKQSSVHFGFIHLSMFGRRLEGFQIVQLATEELKARESARFVHHFLLVLFGLFGLLLLQQFFGPFRLFLHKRIIH